MKNALLETYKKRLAVSDAVYGKLHEGEQMSTARKVAVATLLNNVNKIMTPMNEAFSNSVGTQRADMGEWKKFCLNLTNVAVPSLIAPELVILYPMTSMTGYITYIKYTAGSNKGQTKQGDVFNDVFHLGNVDVNYTSQAVVENITAQATEFVPAWTPVVDGKVELRKSADSQWEEKTLTSGKVTFSAGTYNAARYKYDNQVIPQNDLPIVNAEIDHIAIAAKVRRVAIYYSQLAAFQAKTDYGFNLGDQLAEKAVGQLKYEIDTEVTDLLIKNAVVDPDLKFNKTVPVGVSKSEHYESFLEMIEIGRQKIYDATKRFAPNYILIASNVLPIISFIKSFKPAPAGSINGPYFAGTLNSLKVFVTPNIAPSTFVMGVNGDDMMSSAAVYAPYMPIVPTQLLGMADGAMSQGFSTAYGLEMLNKNLLVAGTVVAEPQVVPTKEQN